MRLSGEAIARGLERISQRERRKALLDQVGGLPIEEIERMLAAKA